MFFSIHDHRGQLGAQCSEQRIFLKRNGTTHRNTEISIVNVVRSANLTTRSLSFHNLYEGMLFRKTHCISTLIHSPFTVVSESSLYR
jgi:hypothetical protein